MTIHVVQVGDTIYEIADLYGVSPDRIILENEIKDPKNLVPGQTIVITYSEQAHTVVQCDNLLQIAAAYGVSLLQLLRNNSFLANRDYIYPGETLIISFGDKPREIKTNGYAFEFIPDSILRKTLPYLTYLSIFGYRIVEGGRILEINDDRLIQTAKEYGVAPIMLLNISSHNGHPNFEVVYEILGNEVLMEKIINNIVNILKEKGYYGVNFVYQYISSCTLTQFELFNTKLYNRLKNEGFYFMISITPNPVFAAHKLTFEKIDFTQLMKHADEVIIMNLLWGAYLGPPSPLAPIDNTNEFLDYIIPQTSPEKLIVGLPLIAYDWELPYIIGLSRANALSLENALALANQNGSFIQFDEVAQAPYFTYFTTMPGVKREHVVWFVDARSTYALLNTVFEKGLGGTGIWNINTYNPQLWLVTNTQFDIEQISSL